MVIVQVQIDFGLVIIKIIRKLEGFFRYKKSKKLVKIGSSSSQHPGTFHTFKLWQRPFQQPFAGNNGNVSIALKFLCIPFPVDYIQDCTHAASVAGWKTSGMKICFLDGIGIKGRKNSTKVVRIIYRNTIEHDQVLIRSTAPHVKSTGKIVQGLDPRKHLHSSKKIGLNKGRCSFNGTKIKSNTAGFNHLTHFLSFTKHIHRLAFDNGPLQPELKTYILSGNNFDLFNHHLISNNRNSNLILPCRYIANYKISIHSRCCTHAGLFNENIGISQRFAIGIIAYKTIDTGCDLGLQRTGQDN